MIDQSSFHETFSNAHALLLLDCLGSIRFCNAAGAHMFCTDAEKLVGRPMASLILDFSVDDLKPAEPGEKSCWTQRVWRRLRGLAPDGNVFPLEALPLELLVLDGSQFFLLYLRPVVEAAEVIDHLRRLQEAVEHSDYSVIITDRKGVIQYVNPAFEMLTGFRREEAIGRTPALFKSNAHSPRFYNKVWARLNIGKEVCVVFLNRTKDGSLYHEEMRIRPFIDSQGQITHFISMGRDVSERVHMLERIEYLANFDMLTGVANRALFKDRLHRELIHAVRHGIGFTLLYLDLDLFKPVNDTYGHATGDLLLQMAATILKQCVRNEDTVARLGGDEFALILKGVSSRECARKILDTILLSLRRGTLIEGRMLTLSASIGACLFPDHGNDECSLLKHADHAMYRAKAAGGNGYCFFDSAESGRRASERRPFNMVEPRINRLSITSYCYPVAGEGGNNVDSEPA